VCARVSVSVRVRLSVRVRPMLWSDRPRPNASAPPSLLVSVCARVSISVLVLVSGLVCV